MGIQLNNSELGAKWRNKRYIQNRQYNNNAIAGAILNDINSGNLIINSNDIADLYNSGLDFTYNSEDPNKKTGYAGYEKITCLIREYSTDVFYGL